MESVRVRTARLLDRYEQYAKDNVPKEVAEFKPDTFSASFGIRLAEGFLEALREEGLYEVYDMDEAPIKAQVLYDQVKEFFRHELKWALKDAGYQYITEMTPYPEGVCFHFFNY